MTITEGAVPEQGQLVQVRSRPWVVNVVKPSSLPTPAMKLPVGSQQNLLTLSSVEDDGLGEELQIVWEIEPGAKVVEKVALPEPTDFNAPEKLDAFLDAVRWGAASTADVKNIQSPFGTRSSRYWHVETEGFEQYRIERIIPFYPFSRDRAKLSSILRTLAIYRLAFGQPRQSELIDHLLKHIPPDKIPEIRKRLLVDLSPISYSHPFPKEISDGNFHH